MDNKQHTLSCLTVSFSKGFLSPNVPLATFTQGDKELIFMLDSGSEFNVTNKKALERIEHKMLNNGEDTHTLTGVGGSEEVSMCEISFTCEKEEFTAKFLVSSTINAATDIIRREHGINIDGILGSKFMREHNIVLDFNTLLAYSRK